MSDADDTTYLTAQEVADLKKVSLVTVKRATASGTLKSDRIKTKKNQQRFTRRYKLSDVKAWRNVNVSTALGQLADLDPEREEVDLELPMEEPTASKPDRSTKERRSYDPEGIKKLHRMLDVTKKK